MKKLNKKGFTIVELVIVIAVIAILAAVLIPTFATVIEKANANAAMQACRNEFTEYLADNESHVIRGGDYIVTKGAYAFIVEDGSFIATAIKGATGDGIKNIQTKNGTEAAATVATWDGTTLTSSVTDKVKAITDYTEKNDVVIYTVEY